MGKVARIAATIGGAYLAAGGFTTAFGLAMMQFGLSSLTSKRVQGQRLTDLGISLSQEGAELIKVLGTARHGMHLAWSSNIVENKESHGGGKGGPVVKVDEFTYSTSLFYVGGIGPIDRVKRLKLNQHVFYNYDDGDEFGFVLSESEDGTYFYGENAAGTKLRVYKGLQNQPVDSMLESAKGAGQWTNYPGLWCVAIEDLPLDDFNNSVPNATGYPYNATRDLPSVIEWLGAQVGYDPGDFDLSALEGELVSENEDEGFIVGSQGSAAHYIQELCTAHYFKLVPVDGVLRAVKDGGAAVARIPLSAQRVRVLSGAGEGIGSAPDATQLGTPARHDDAQSAPYQQSVQFYDPGRENNTGLRTYNLPTDTQTFGSGSDTAASRRKETTTVSFSMGGGRALKLAKILALRRRIEAESYSPSLGLAFRHLAPGDVVTLETVQGAPLSGTREDVPVWISTLRSGQPGPLAVSAPRSDRLLYDIAAPTDTAGLPGLVFPVDEPVFFYSETNALFDRHNAYLGIYVAWGLPFAGRNSEKCAFACDAMVQTGTEGDIKRNWIHPPQSTIGNTVGTLGDFTGGSTIWDDDTVLTVDFATGRDLASATDEELYNGKNALIVGREILQFGTATYIGVQGDGRKRWELRHLLRGRRGTEYWMGRHSASEAVCVLDHGAAFVAFDTSSLGLEVQAQVGYKYADPVNLGITLHGYVFYPYAPATIRSSRDGGGAVAVTFENRTRYGYSFGPVPQNNPFGETLDSGQSKYEMDLLDGPDGAVLKTYTSDTLSFTISAADQVTYLGGLQSAISVVLYQNSGIVGRGYPAPATV